MRIVLFDIDHTIADASWRDAIMPPSETWDTYHSQAVDDKPFTVMIDLVNALLNDGYTPIGFTMRPEKWRQSTIAWLYKHNCYLSALLMRANNDFEPANTAKIQLVRSSFTEANIKNIRFIVDDREDVCQAFTNEFGITSLQVRNK